jgi:cyclomaltodextrinase
MKNLGLFLFLVFVFFFTNVSQTIAGAEVRLNEDMKLNTIEFVPQWAKSVVWYQIFPERFRNGDADNDPTVNDIKGADPKEPPKAWQIHPWGSDWYQLQDYELKNGETELWKHMLRRRYGGDLQGIIDKLDWLKELGISGIYLNPVFDAPSLHKYDGACYHHIDPNLGPDPQGDRILMQQENPLDPSAWVWTKADELALKLIHEAHKRDIRIIFDGVFNHMGINSFAFRDLVKNQQSSAYKDWFIVHSWDNPATGENFTYEGWYGVKSLPELREDEHGIVKGPREYIFAATERWMNPKGMGTTQGIDGWRLDVAFCISHPFWKAWRKHIKSINPQAYLTAEIVKTPEEAIPYLEGDEFDGEMNYNFAMLSAEVFFNPDHLRITVAEFDRQLKELRELYPPGVPYVVMNLFDSHDTNRIGSYIVNRGIESYRNWGNYFQMSKVEHNANYQVRKPTEDELRMQKLFVIFQMTYVGAPMIYYGDEVGMWGANDPDCRKPMLWDDIEHQPEVYNPDQSKRIPDTVEINRELLAHYKKLITIRNRYEALQTGDFQTLLADDKKDVYVFSRSLGDQTVIVALNNSQSRAVVPLSLDKNTTWRDVLNDKEHKVDSENLRLQIKPKWAAILVTE